jgi:hypothetical protein
MSANYSFYPQVQQGYQSWQQGYPQPVPDQLMQYRMMNQQAQNQPQNQLQQPISPPADSPMIWVQGEAGAKAYLVSPGNTVVLWDSESEVIYIKSANQAGIPVMRVFDYKERMGSSPAPAQQSVNEFVTRKEFNDLAAKLNALLEKEEEDG